MKSKWTGFARFFIIILILILFANAMSLFVEIRRDVTRANRAYGLAALDDYFDDASYYDVYECTVKNSMSTEEIGVDTGEYEAFGRYYNAYTLYRMYPEKTEYLDIMNTEKQHITWNKILNIIDELEKDLY